MASLNETKLIGNVGVDPEIRSFQNGGRVANFTLATTEKWKDKKSGEVREDTEWHKISVTNDALVKIVEKYVKKGSRLYLCGQNKTRKWTDKEGVERYTTEVMLRPYRGELILLSSAEGKAAPADADEVPEIEG